MDKSIPAGAAVLLQFIYETEVSRKAPACYETIYGHNEAKLPKKITTMTINEIQAAQGSWSSRFGSSATGAGQIMKATLAQLIGELKLTGSELFSPDMQDRLFYHLLKRRGYLDFMSGKISRTEFGKRLAQEWASFPVLAATQGAKRALTRGQSYYAGDGLNKSLVKPETVESVLNQVKALGDRAQDNVAPINLEPTAPVIVDAVEPKPVVVADPPKMPTSVKVTLATGFLVAAGTMASTIWEWASNVPCNALGLLCGG